MKYGRLTAVRKIGVRDGNSIWLYVCDCGKQKKALRCNVVCGATSSCGCLLTELNKSRITHGFISKFKKNNRNPRFYAIWSGMKNRCENRRNPSFKQYGGADIVVCKRWQFFANFYIDMLKSYQRHILRHGVSQTSIDRKNNSKSYFPSNCRWATRLQQARNKKRYA